MRIGIDATALPRQLAGAGRYILNLIVYLAKIDSTNEYYVFIKWSDKALFTNLPSNFNTIICPNLHNLPRTVWQLTRPPHHAHRLGLDIWHAPHYTAPYGLNGTSLVVTIHDLTFYLFPEFYSWVRRESFQHFIRRAAHRADGLICVSNSTKSDLLRLFPDATDRTFVIHSGIEDLFDRQSSNSKTRVTRQTYCNGAPLILFVGTLERRKNVTLLLSAFSRLITHGGTNHHLVLSGQAGNDYERIVNRISELGIKERVHILGYVPENELISLYQAADLLVLPSYYEGFGFPVIEAMACGVPVLCTNISATAELAGHPDMLFANGNVKELFQRMSFILKNVDKRGEIIDHGISRAKEFKWENTALETLRVYEETQSTKSKYRAFKNAQDRPLKSSVFSLAEAILRTLTFSDLFEFPLKPNEIYRDLPQISISFEDFNTALGGNELPNQISQKDGYYFLKGRAGLVELRAQKSDKTRTLMNNHRKTLKLIANFPFVRAVSLSGTAAFENVNGKDDIDLFILVNGFRTWTTYLLLVLFLKLKRKRHIICINCLDGSTNASTAVKNFFVAHQIAHLQPISGNGAFEDYWRANDWILRYLPQARAKRSLKGYDTGTKNIKRGLERILSIPIFNGFEQIVYLLYSKRILRLASRKQSGRIYIDANQIQLYTNDHQERIMREFDQRLMKVGLKQ